MKKSSRRPPKKAPPPPPNPAEEKRARQVRLLQSVRRLKANEDYSTVIVPRLEAAEEAAISKFLDPEVSDADLRRAQARFIAVRHLANLLDDLEESLESAVEAHPEQEKRDAPPAPPPPDPATALLRTPAGGWFDSPTITTPDHSAENT